MSENYEDIIPEPEEISDEERTRAFFIDILTGAKINSSLKNELVQKVLRQLIESYGFDRTDIELNYNPMISQIKRKRIDIAIFVPGSKHTTDNLHRIIVCKTQKKRDKLRSVLEAESDWRYLTDLMELIPNVSFGMWTNGLEEFFFQLERTRFEVRPKPLGLWPVPGEGTTDLERTGGVIQISADSEDLEDALSRCYQFLNRNLGYDPKESFKQLSVLIFAKMFDETRPSNDRNFWIRGEEPFTESGHQAIHSRIMKCFKEAKLWQPNVLAKGWDLNLDPHETARLATELARYSFGETQPFVRTKAFRSIARRIMDGSEGRYPTPLNVAEMIVQMLDPKPNERIMDCACGTGTFLAITAVNMFSKTLNDLGTTSEEADAELTQLALQRTIEWASINALGCDIDPFLAVASRINMLFTIGNPGRIFRLDARTFPEGDLDGTVAGKNAMPLGTMDIVMVNPWFSTKDGVSDESILNRYELGHVWVHDEIGGYRNSGNLATVGVPPEILFLERAIQWAKPGTGRVGILLPNGVLSNPGDENVRWWILHNCEVLASVDLPIEPFKVTVKEYGITPASPSFLLLRRRSLQELKNSEHPEYKVFMAIVDRAGVDARGNLLFRRAPDGEELIFNDEIIERVRIGGQVQVRRVTRPALRIHDELKLVAEKYKEYCFTGEVTI